MAAVAFEECTMLRPIVEGDDGGASLQETTWPCASSHLKGVFVPSAEQYEPAHSAPSGGSNSILTSAGSSIENVSMGRRPSLLMAA